VFDVVSRFAIGLALGHLLPRLPMMLVTRGKTANARFAPHPAPVRLEPHLTARVLLMRRLWWLVLPASLIPMSFGAASLVSGNAAFGFGLWIASGWTALQRVLTLLNLDVAPIRLETAHRLQAVMDRSAGDDGCCALPEPVWEAEAVRCAACRTLLDPMPRPDLGRPRSDRWPARFLRLWVADGHAMLLAEPKVPNE